MSALRRSCWLLLLASLSRGQDWREIVDEIRRQVLAELEKTDNYTCVESIERRYWYDLSDACKDTLDRPSIAPSMTDRLRLDVAVAKGAEIFSWHGESEFTSTDVADVVSDGPSASGSFVGYLRNVFGETGVIFVSHGSAGVDGRATYQFDFRVKKSISHFLINKVIVAFHGSFSVDASTLRLLSIVLIPDEYPETTKICKVNSTLRYGADGGLFVPQSVVMLIAHTKRVLTESRMQYTACRAFGSESTIHFDSVDDNGAAAASVSATKEKLAAGLRMRVALSAPITDETAFAGDAVEGSLAKPLKLESGEVIPAGTPVHGVIKRMQTQIPDPTPTSYRFGSMWMMKIEFDRFVHQGKVYTFRAQIHENHGAVLFNGAHFKLDRRYTAEYETVE